MTAVSLEIGNTTVALSVSTALRPGKATVLWPERAKCPNNRTSRVHCRCAMSGTSSSGRLMRSNSRRKLSQALTIASSARGLGLSPRLSPLGPTGFANHVKRLRHNATASDTSSLGCTARGHRTFHSSCPWLPRPGWSTDRIEQHPTTKASCTTDERGYASNTVRDCPITLCGRHCLSFVAVQAEIAHTALMAVAATTGEPGLDSTAERPMYTGSEANGAKAVRGKSLPLAARRAKEPRSLRCESADRSAGATAWTKTVTSDAEACHESNACKTRRADTFKSLHESADNRSDHRGPAHACVILACTKTVQVNKMT
mmetsp:Transcript_32417/g.86990  ORF Transcript_32417/g.86990 Transcript_32417/m.86990 type:complete len:315 (+) Transcript_32417:492-1436(+)